MVDVASITVESGVPHKILFATPAWSALTGYAADEVMGTPVSVLHGPLTCNDTLRALSVAMAGARLSIRTYSWTGARISAPKIPRPNPAPILRPTN